VPDPDATPAPPTPPRPLTDFAAAIGFLTLLPFGREWPEGRPPRSVGWYGWVGWVLGGTAALAVSALARWSDLAAPGVPLLAAVLVVAGWTVTTRFLHWDGLADTVDGLWGGSTRERRLEIMRDSRIGSFGAAAMLMTALVQVTAAAVLIGSGNLWVLVAAPVIARFCASLAAWELPAARRDGLGLTSMGHGGAYDRLVAGASALLLLALLAAGATPHSFIIVAAVGIISGLVVPRALSHGVGGMTGDLFGASILLVEAIVLLTGAFFA
jgi:adenosylcobinamide-GDP ribazoletransferase